MPPSSAPPLAPVGLNASNLRARGEGPPPLATQEEDDPRSTFRDTGGGRCGVGLFYAGSGCQAESSLRGWSAGALRSHLTLRPPPHQSVRRHRGLVVVLEISAVRW